MSNVDTPSEVEPSLNDRIASKFGVLGTSTPSEEDGTQAPAADLAEIEVDGDLFQVPEKLKDAFLRTKDYTEKTQALAEKQKSIDHAREIAQASQLDRSFQESVAPEQQEIAVIDAYLQQASKMNWSGMTTEEMLRHKVELDNVKERRDTLKESIQGKRSQFDEQVKTRFGELRAKAREMASKSITGFTEATEKEIRAFGVSEGLTETEVDNVLLDPRSFKVLWKAMQFDKVKAGATKVPENATKLLKPSGASERMPAKTIAQLNLAKALKAAKTSGEKAKAIEANLEARFMKRAQ